VLLKNLLFLLVLIGTPVMAQISVDDVKVETHEKIESQLHSVHPSLLYLYAARLFQEDRKEEAVFWFYVGQLRFRYLLVVNPDLPLDGAPALMDALNENVGLYINEWVGKNPLLWVSLIDKALEWDTSNINVVTPKETHVKELLQVRSGLVDLRNYIVNHASEIREQRKAAGLPVD